MKQVNSQPDILSILVLDDECGSFKRHSGAVQETRTKVVSHKREVQPWLYTRTSQIDGKCGTVGDLEIDKLERFSLECRKVIGFAITTLRDWLSRHFFIQSEVKPKPIASHSHSFSRALRQLLVITSSFDWFTVLSVSFLMG